MTVFPTSNFHIPTFVVNMVKDIEKRNKIAEILDEFPMLDYKFVKAVEGKKLSTGELEVLVDMCAFKNRYGHQATLPAIGCSLSHIMIYNEAKRRKSHGLFSRMMQVWQRTLHSVKANLQLAFCKLMPLQSYC